MLGGQKGYALRNYVAEDTHGSGGSGGERSVGVLGDVLVGLLGSTRGSLLDGLRDGVDGVLDAVRGERADAGRCERPDAASGARACEWRRWVCTYVCILK